MAKILKRDLSKEAFCENRGKYSFGEIETKSEISNSLTIYSIVTETIKGILSGEYDSSEALDIIDTAGQLSTLPAEDEAIKASAKRMVKTFFTLTHGEKPVSVITSPVTVTLPYSGDEIDIRPDLIYDDGETLTVAYIKTGKSYVLGNEFLPTMYNAILYGRTLVPENESRIIACSYIEVNIGKTQSIQDDVWPLPEGITSEQDDKAKAEYEERLQGITCEGNDCKYCPGRFECQYKAPALALDVTHERKVTKVKLSSAQEDVVHHMSGNALVIAGPGAGKTECMCQNVLYTLGKMVENGVDPIEALHSFLLITFTEAGANEMKGRLTFRLLTQGIEANGENRKIAASTDDVKAMTFNSYAFDIDKMFWQELGYSKELAVIENTERGAIIQNLLTDSPVDGLRYENAVARGGAILFVGKCFEFLKSGKVDLEAAGVADALRGEFYSDKTMSGLGKKEPDWNGIVDLFNNYCECLKVEGLMEFADQEPAALKMIDAHPEILTNLGYVHIIADEFQDSSPLQMEFMKRFAKSGIVKNGGSLMAVGDDFQSIYGFRDADPDNMLKFYERLDETGETFFLTDNYRSVQNVVNFGNRVIARNVNKVDKVITTTREEGDPVILKPFYRNETELKYIAWKIKLLIEQDGVAPEDIAFLSYRRLTVQKMAALLTEINVPVVVKIPTSVAEDPNVAAVEALSKAIEEPGSTELYLQYLVAKYNGHLYGDWRTKDDIQKEIEEMRMVFSGFSYMGFEEQRMQFHKFVDVLDTRDEIFDYFKQKCYSKEDFVEEIDFIDKFTRFGQEEERKMSQEYAGVTLTTAHSSKGLEWEYVFASISDYDNKVINKKKADDPEVEEIRRLEFVAFTRAKDHLMVTSTYEAWNEPKKDPESGKTIGRDIGYNRFLQELMENEDMEYIPVDPNEALREKHKAAVSKANAKKAAEKRKANAEKKDKVKMARLLAKKETGHILTLVEQDTLAKLQKKYNKKK